MDTQLENKLMIQTQPNAQLNAQKGRVAVPMLLWFAGVPFGLVLVLWFLFFRGH